MAYSFGRNDKVAIAQEASYKEAWSQPSFGLQQATCEFEPVITPIRDTFATGLPQKKLEEFARGLQSVTGTLKMAFRKEQMGSILLNLLGSVATPGTLGSGFYKHTFTLSNATPKSVRLLLQKANSQWQLRGVVFTKIVVEFMFNQFLELTADFIGADFTSAAVGAVPTFQTVASGVEPAYKHHNAAWNINGNLTWSKIVWTLERTYASGPEESYDGGSSTRVRLESANPNDAPVKITAVATCVHQGLAIQNLFTGDSTFEAYFRDGTLDSPVYYLAINMGKCKALSHKFELDGEGLTKETIEFEAFHDLGTYYGSSDFQVTTQDKQTTPVTQ